MSWLGWDKARETESEAFERVAKEAEQEVKMEEYMQELLQRQVKRDEELLQRQEKRDEEQARINKVTSDSLGVLLAKATEVKAKQTPRDRLGSQETPDGSSERYTKFCHDKIPTISKDSSAVAVKKWRLAVLKGAAACNLNSRSPNGTRAVIVDLIPEDVVIKVRSTIDFEKPEDVKLREWEKLLQLVEDHFAGLEPPVNHGRALITRKQHRGETVTEYHDEVSSLRRMLGLD
jgi:hypothetical protein